MDETTRNFIAALEQIARKTPPNTQVRQTAVRWLNRLYYELAGWNKEFINFLDTYPGTRIDAAQEDYECFQRDFSKHLEMLDADYPMYRHRQYFYGESNKFPQNEFCMRLEFLAARIPKDFSWMREQDPKAYQKFIELVGLARSSRLMFANLTLHLHNDLYMLKSKVSPWNSKTQPSKEEIMELFDEYKKRSVEQLSRIKTSAFDIKINLLSIEEYDEALKKQGSLNPNLLVIGEVAVSHYTFEGDFNMGDRFDFQGSGNTIINRSIVQNAFNKVKADYDEETANALERVGEEINQSGNQDAAENFEAFSAELSKPQPRKALLRTLWKGTLEALPTLAQLSSVVNLIVRLFS